MGALASMRQAAQDIRREQNRTHTNRIRIAMSHSEGAFLRHEGFVYHSGSVPEKAS